MIITNNEEALRVKCTNALPDEISPIIDRLDKELQYSAALGREGLGLAAVQIGIPKNVAIVRLENYRFNLANAKIRQGYDKAIFESEGCLSFPGRYERTMRFQEIIVDNEVEPYSFIATGLLAVVCLHEIDHTDGILLPDIALKEIKTIKKLRPNDLCNCGSKIKFKKCCGK